MTEEEIKIIANGGSCVIINEKGQYVGREKGEIAFTNNIKKAFVYNYIDDNVPIQINHVEQQFGKKWKAIAYSK